jgi:NADH oxidase (H2O2-forming)
MKYKCLKCESVFDVDLVAKCLECGEMMDLKPLNSKVPLSEEQRRDSREERRLRLSYLQTITRRDIDKSRKIVIIGLGTGGLYASRAASKTDRHARITIIERRDYDMFSPCGLPYAIEGRVKRFEDLKHSVPTSRRVKKLLQHEALFVDTNNKRVRVRNLESGIFSSIDYDSLILATGSDPIILPIPGAEKFLGNGVYTVTNPENAEELRKAALGSKTAVVVGGGAIGLEIALALKALGLDVWVTKRTPPPFPQNLDPDMGKIISNYIESKGLHILFGEGIDRINGKDRVESVVISGKTIPTDIVVMAVGVKPRSDIATRSGIKTNERGAIITDERMETNVKDIYAIGDCCLSFSGIDNNPINTPLATTSFRQALVAGENAAGGKMTYNGVLGTFVSHLADLEIATTGYNSSIAERNGFEVITGRVNLKTKPNYMPGAKDISVKLVVDAETGRIIGGQAIGEEGAAWRIDIVALAISKGMTIDEFNNIELAYCPPISNLQDPLLVAADAAFRHYIRARAKVIQHDHPELFEETITQH